MTKADLDAIRERYEKATGCRDENAAFFAATNTYVSALLAEVDRYKRISASALDLCKTLNSEIEKLRRVLEGSRIDHVRCDCQHACTSTCEEGGECDCMANAHNMSIDYALGGD